MPFPEKGQSENSMDTNIIFISESIHYVYDGTVAFFFQPFYVDGSLSLQQLG
jgi:hypothetical protein